MRKILNKTWSLFSQKEKQKATWMLVVALLMAIIEALGVISIMPFLSTLARPEFIRESSLLSKAYSATNINNTHKFTILLGLVSIVLVITSSAFKTISQHLINRFIHTQRHSISARLLKCYLHQPYEFFLGRNSAELAKGVLSEIDILMSNLIQPLSQIITQSIIVLSMLILIFIYDPKIAIGFILVFGTLYGLIYGLVRKKLQIKGAEIQALNKDRYQTCNEALHGIRDIKLRHAEKAYSQRYINASRTQARHMSVVDTLSQAPLYLVEATGYTGLIALALLLLTQSGDIARILPAIGLYGFVAYRILPAAQIIYRGFARLKFSSAILDSIHHDLSLEYQTYITPLGNSLLFLKEIKLRDISYAYPTSEKIIILHSFNLSITKGSSIGIVGESGAGKSTLMDIILGLIQPKHGSIEIDNIPITKDNLLSWQSNIGYVPQNIYLIDSSVIENVSFGEELNIEKIQTACKIAQIHDFIINDLPNGYETKVGDRGVRLSGGQRQRIGIARALYKSPPIILLDEATSALDFATAQSVISAIKMSGSTETLIMITHDARLLNFCDHVVELSPRAA